MKIYKSSELNEVINLIKNDGVVCVPTDTVYGICARINSKKSYDKLVEVKNRPSNKHFPVMCANKKQIENIAIIDERINKIIDAFMPGPITLILNKKSDDLINNGVPTIALRMAPTKELEEIMKSVGPIFMTSANQSGKEVCNTIEKVQESCPLLDGILEGNVSYNEASTIVDLTKNDIKILRDGPIKIEDIKKII